MSSKLFVAVLVVVLAHASPASAQSQCPQPVALFESVTNNVQVVAVSAQAPIRPARRTAVCAGDRVSVGDNSRAVLLVLSSNTPLALDQNTVLVITAATAGQGDTIDLLEGALLFLTRVRRAFQIRTPFVNAAIEGTEFVVRVLNDRTVITVFEGAVRASNDFGNVLVGPGQQAEAVKGQAPQLLVTVRPRDAVQWALHFQPVLAGDTLEQLEAVPAASQDARFFARRAALLLGAGQLDEARADLDRGQALDAANADVLALRAIVAVALNDPIGALDNGRAAVERAPQSPSARLAHSYALQAGFRLDEARATLEQAARDNPKDGAVWARLAELRLMLSDIGGAADAAGQAVAMAPLNARVHVVQGFVELARSSPGPARTAFDRAIELDSSDPQARLGLGLARIRTGNLAEGRSHFEMATALDPGNALVRSYLGKAYFEERRAPLAGEQFDLAKALDANDPTSRFYDAIRKQTLNRPVEALQDLTEAIRLNDGRAVYRSRFLLDQDLAARNASLGRIYRDLGFGQLALVQGWRSLEADPGDHSGHRFLADTYSVLPRHEVARVSELLQSQLLQPLSATPVPPRLGEADLFFLAGTGPDALAFNEFNPLFTRDGVTAQLSGVAGGTGLFADEATVSGLWKRVAFSAGQFHYQTDGFRANNFQDRDTYNAFVQTQVTGSTSIQAEIRGEDLRVGDITLLFDPRAFSPAESTRIESSTVRLGLRHTFNARSQVVASVYRNDRTRLYDSPASAAVPASVKIQQDTSGWVGEANHYLRAGRWRVTSGATRFESRTDREDSIDVRLPFPPFVVTRTSRSTDHPESTAVYTYATAALPRLDVTLGAAAGSVETGLFSVSQLSPKFGVSWRLSESTAIRAAAFRTLGRRPAAKATIEPTQVAGFNQLFNDENGWRATRYGVAIDRTMLAQVAAGAEFSVRDLSVPVEFRPVTGNPVVRWLPNREQVARSYLYWTPSAKVSVSLEYLFERFDRRPGATPDNVLALRTHRVPAGIRFFLDRGWFGGLSVTGIAQRGRFDSLAFLQAGQDRFWLTDATLGYRLPRRYGRVALEVRNALDQSFRFQDTDPASPLVKPSRVALVTFVLGS